MILLCSLYTYLSVVFITYRSYITYHDDLYRFPGSSKSLTIGEAVMQQRIIVEKATTSKDFESEECKLLHSKTPSIDLLPEEKRQPVSTYTVTGMLFLFYCATRVLGLPSWNLLNRRLVLEW